MNTKALLSLEELVNQPELVLKRLETYGELVLIRDNRPYCVVSKVREEEDSEGDSEGADGGKITATQPSFAGLTEGSFSGSAVSDSWFLNEVPQGGFEPLRGTEAARKATSERDFAVKSEQQQGQDIHEPQICLETDDIAADDYGNDRTHNLSQELNYVPYEVLKAQKGNLWDAMATVLAEHPKHTMHAVDIARIINERGLYQTRDGKPVTAIQVRSRVTHRPDQFEALGGNMIRLLHR